MSKAIVVTNRKGGVGKTTSVMNLGAGLAPAGKKVLLVDLDPQASPTLSLSHREPDKLEASAVGIISRVVNDEDTPEGPGIIHVSDNVDLLSSGIQLFAVEISMMDAMSRGLVLRYYAERARERYDFIPIDCMPSLGILTVNTLASADSVLVPVQAAYLPVESPQQLVKIIYAAKWRLSSRLSIEGILSTMVDRRTLYAKEIIKEMNEAHGKPIPVFSTEILISVRASETSMVAEDIYDYNPKEKTASAYSALTQEVSKHGC